MTGTGSGTKLTSFLNRESIYFENAKWKDYDGRCIFIMAAANSMMAVSVMICTQLLLTLTETLLVFQPLQI